MKIVQMECDGCGDGVLGDRREARESHGWKRRKVDGAMKDLCRPCAAARDAQASRPAPASPSAR
jgi:hypothetical protein